MRTVPALSAVAALAFLLTGSARACTGIRLQAKDGAVVYARTMEFGAPLPPVVVAVPRGAELVGMAPGGKPGLKWTARYAALGMGTGDYDVVADGLSEKGLAAGLFYHPGYAKYPEPRPGEEGNVVAALQLPTYLLTRAATVKEARELLAEVVVAGVDVKELGGVPPFHAVVHDASGDCVVVEFLDGKTVVFENPLGVVTNSPTFDWHATNLRNYVNLTATNVPPVKLGELKLGQFGEGSGLLGLPGDFTPPSRFVRAVAFSQAAEQAETAEGAVNTAFHILNNFDIVPGYARASKGEKGATGRSGRWPPT